MAHIQSVSPGLQEWNDEVQNAKASLHPDEEGAVYVMSITRRKQGIVGGVLSVVTLNVAAKLVAGETHREATPEEVESWRVEQEDRRKKQLAQAVKQDAKFNLDLGPVAEALLRLGMQAGQAQPAPTPAELLVPAVPEATTPPRTSHKGKPIQPPVQTGSSDPGTDERF